MKKILLILGILLFACQTEPIEEIKTADFKHPLPAKADSIQIAKNVFQKRHSNGRIEIIHYDYLDVNEPTIDYIVSPSITAGLGVNTVIFQGGSYGNEKGYIQWPSGFKTSTWQIKSWTDSSIEAYVPPIGYSGNMSILAPDNTTVLSTENITIKYGIYPAQAGVWPNSYYKRVAFDGPEVVWHPEIGAYDQNIIDLVQQAFDEWTKYSGMNWSIGEPVAIDANSSASDGNFVFGFGPSPGAAHNSMAYTNCGDDTFIVSGGRVVFDEMRNWVAALHEFGHAIGLPHSNNPGTCMSPSGGKSISTWDAEGASDKVNWSVANTPSCATKFVKGNYVQTYTYYLDADRDGYGGSTTITVESPTPPSGYVSKSGDCNDSDASINPGETEIKGNGIDENCNGMRDDRIKGGGGKPDKGPKNR